MPCCSKFVWPSFFLIDILAQSLITVIITSARYIPRRNLWINPDCGLKTRGWKEVRESLTNMVAVAEALRASA